MTTIITRLYQDEKTADAVVKALRAEGHPDRNFDVIKPGADAAHQMTAAHVAEDSAAKYASAMSDGNVLIVMRAPFVPFGAAMNAMTVMDSKPAIDAGVENENVYISEMTGVRKNSVYSDHPLFLTRRPSEKPMQSKTVSERMGFRLLSNRKPRRNSLTKGHISTKIFPMKLLKKDERKKSTMSGNPLLTASLLPIPLLSKRSGGLSVTPGGGTPFSDTFGMPLLTRR